MKTSCSRWVLLLLVGFASLLLRAQAQQPLDCNCLQKLPALRTNACQAFIPDLCAVMTNCYNTTVVPPPTLSCSQTPTAGTAVGPGPHTISITVTDLGTGQASTCAVTFAVSPLPACAFTLLCATNKTVQCGSTWSFDPPTWTNNCSPPPGTPSNGVIVTVISTITNGTCPEVITRTWQATDDCQNHDQCSQTVTVVDTIPPTLNCTCITNSSAFPVQMTVTACNAQIPDLCFPARTCAFDNCGPLTCAQSPAAGTSVGPGVYPITVTVYDCASNSASCVVNFTVLTPAGGCGFLLLCPSNQTVQCGTPWTFTPPGWTNNCSPPPGTPSNGVVLTVIGTITNGTCPQVITRTWQGVDDCKNTNQCSQTVTIVDTLAPQLNCACLTNNPVFPITLTVFACTSSIPDLCPAARVCATDACGVTGCSQTPAAGTVVGPGVYPLTVTVYDCASNTASCTLNYTVIGGAQTNVWNSGMGGINGNVLLPAGTPDTNYNLVSVPPSGCTGPAQVMQAGFIPGVWQANGPNSQWISANSSGQCQGGVYHYRLCFNLPCDNASIVGQWTCDDLGAIFLNGQPAPVQTIPSPQYPNLPFYKWFPVNITNGFVCGNNCLDFYVTNANIGINPTGLRAELTNIVNTCVCTCTNCLVSLYCPTNMTVLTCSNSAVVFYPAPSASSSCGTITNISFSPPNGSNLPIGTTVVTCTASDSLGHTDTCSFTVTVVQGPNCCTIVPVLRLYSGATNNVPGVLPGGALDIQFLTGLPFFTTPNPYVPNAINGWWIPNNTVSKWVGPYPFYAYAPGGVFYYTNRFFLCSTNQATITGRWAGDDSGRILLNGVATANVLPNGWAFTNWTPVSITSGFVPGWNQLVFAITNGGYSPTGLRTEITGSACCNNCIGISCPPNVVTNTCGTGVVVNFAPPLATSSCGNIVSVSASPPSGSVFPFGTTVVTCAAIDSAGNAATCTFTVTVVHAGAPPIIHCPPNQIRYTCTSSAIVYYAATATGNIGPITYTPPSGTAFPLGTNFVACTATNACGIASCTFRVVVISTLAGPPNMTFTRGLPDNFVLPVDPANTNACMVAAESGFPYWKKYDATPVNTLFGDRFTGLPNNIVQAQLVVRMRPENDGIGVGVGSDNDGLFVCLTNCTPTGWSYIASIKTLPGAGGNWFPGHPATTFTNNLSAAIIAQMNSTLHLDVMIADDTTVDYMQLRLWLCPPPINPNGGIPHWSPNLAAPANLTVTAQPQLASFGPIGPGAALSVSPGDGQPTSPNDVQIGIGGGQAFGFTTILDMSAPEGAQVVISIPTDAGTNAPLFALVKGCKPRCGWDVVVIKRFFDDGGPVCRVSAVNTNGDVLDSFTATEADAETDSLLTVIPEVGVDQFPVSFLFDSTTGEVTVTFPGSVARRLCNGLPCPRGWDGTIKGRVAGGPRGWDGTIKCPCVDDSSSRVVFTPMGGTGVPPRASLVLSSTGLSEMVLAGEHLYTMGGHEVTAVDDGPVTLQSTAQGDGASFASLDDFTGVTLDLGRSASFDIGIHHFENGDIPTEEQLFRISGPKFPIGLTNRPPPLPIELRLSQQAPNSIGISIDYSALAASGIQVQVYSNGVYIAFGDVPAGAILPDDPLVLDRWPERLGLMGSNAIVRLTSSELFNVDGFQGDEIRFVPALTADSPPFDFASGLDCRTPSGVESLLYDLQSVPACAPAALSVANSPTGATFTWSGDGYRLLGAETLGGPWLELGVTSPVTLAPNAPQRFFRLVCQ
ncbi:MAG TPA: HYR domain-containing protein [Candidatus Binatia bacterium]|jgi:hypothetical protein|nr:HYR domain-containing protein [Candidatus Binatia bacterium]